MFHVPDIKKLLSSIDELLPLTKEAAESAKQSIQYQTEMIKLLNLILEELKKNSNVITYPVYPYPPKPWEGSFTWGVWSSIQNIDRIASQGDEDEYSD